MEPQKENDRLRTIQLSVEWRLDMGMGWGRKGGDVMKQGRGVVMFMMMMAVLLTGRPSHAALKKGEMAHGFAELKAMQKKPMVVLYFFKFNSKPSQEGLRHFYDLYRQYEKAGIGFLAITQDSEEEIKKVLKNPLPFPFVRDDGTIFRQYEVQVILPTTYVLGPGGRIADIFEGGGSSSYQMLMAVAQRGLQLGKTEFSKMLFETALKSDANNVMAKAGLARSYLKAGDLSHAETEFAKIAKRDDPDAVLGKAGLADVYVARGEHEKALLVADEIQKKYPGNGLAHLIKGNVRAAQGHQHEALSEFSKATEGKLSNDWQTAEAYNRSGQIYSSRGEYALAETMYQNAVIQNPFSPDILSNRGALYEKKGQPQKAMVFYQDAVTADPNDEISKSLMKRVERSIAFKGDMERQKRINTLVSDFAKRYREGKVSEGTEPDPWMARPLTVALLGLKVVGVFREGVVEILEDEISQRLSEGGRMIVVEREILDKLLGELSIGASDLADQETVQLGRLLSARLISTGSLVHTPEGTRISLRLIDPETSVIKMTYTDRVQPNQGIIPFALSTSAALSQMIRGEYPLKGRVASVDTEEVIVNLGARHGMTVGTRLLILDDGDPIVVDEKTIGYQQKRVGLLQVLRVSDGLSYATVLEQGSAVQINQKVIEEMEEGADQDDEGGDSTSRR